MANRQHGAAGTRQGSHAMRRTKQPQDRTSIYDRITQQIIEQLEAGRAPWVQPWSRNACGPDVGIPHNAVTGRGYSGINILMLWGEAVVRGYPHQSWLTYRQAQAAGGHVRKGEKGATVFYAGRFVPDQEKHRAESEGRDARGIPFLRAYTVFNIDQCDGLPEDIAQPSTTPVNEDLIQPRARAILDNSGVAFTIGGDRAFYSVGLDRIHVPPPQAFHMPIDWHRTMLHELGHATGHPKRLGRDLSGAFGSPKYAFEELVAELCAAFTCSSLGIEPTVRHADYIGSWLEVLKNDSRAIFRAASQASRAADWILAHDPERDAGATSNEEEEREALAA